MVGKRRFIGINMPESALVVKDRQGEMEGRSPRDLTPNALLKVAIFHRVDSHVVLITVRCLTVVAGVLSKGMCPEPRLIEDQSQEIRNFGQVSLLEIPLDKILQYAPRSY